MVILLDEKKGVGVVPQRKERREKDKEKGKKEKEERGGGKSKARIGEIEDPKNRKKVHVEEEEKGGGGRRRKADRRQDHQGGVTQTTQSASTINHQNAQNDVWCIKGWIDPRF